MELPLWRIVTVYSFFLGNCVYLCHRFVPVIPLTTVFYSVSDVASLSFCVLLPFPLVIDFDGAITVLPYRYGLYRLVWYHFHFLPILSLKHDPFASSPLHGPTNLWTSIYCLLIVSDNMYPILNLVYFMSLLNAFLLFLSSVRYSPSRWPRALTLLLQGKVDLIW